jgi:hypothetical protein
MSKMWKGPTPALIAAQANSLWAAIHRRNSRLGIFSDTDFAGQKATAFCLSKGRDGEWCRRDLGVVEGDSPLSTAFKLSHEFTEFDAELLSLHHEYVESLADEAVVEARHLVKRIDGQIYDLQDVLSLVRA